MTRAEILASACQGIEQLRRAQVGAGPMTERVVARQRATELLRPFFAVKKWPHKMQAAADEINKLLLELS